MSSRTESSNPIASLGERSLKARHRRSWGSGFLTPVLITGLLLFAGLWLIQQAAVTEVQAYLGLVWRDLAG